MRYIRILAAMACSNIKLLCKRLFGCRIAVPFMNFVSPAAHLYTGRGGRIVLGKKVGIQPNTELKANGGIIRMGDGCFLNRNCMVVAHGQIILEDQVTVGPGTCIYDHDHDGSGGYVSRPVHIGQGAWIGANCVILKGVTIGEGSVIAAGSVITKDVPPRTAVVQKRDTHMKSL